MTGDRIQAQRTWKGKTGLTGGSLKCTSKMLGQKGLQGIRKDVLNRKKKKSLIYKYPSYTLGNL